MPSVTIPSTKLSTALCVSDAHLYCTIQCNLDLSLLYVLSGCRNGFCLCTNRNQRAQVTKALLLDVEDLNIKFKSTWSYSLAGCNLSAALLECKLDQHSLSTRLPKAFHLLPGCTTLQRLQLSISTDIMKLAVG